MKPDRLSCLLGRSYSGLLKIRKDILSERCQQPISALDAYKTSLLRENEISSGSRRLDAMLGSFQAGQVYEVVGATNAGKSQLCLTAVAECLMAGGQINYIDTKRDFSIQRLQQILSARGASESRLLENVILHWANTETEMVETLTNVEEEEGEMQLLVVDNISLPLLKLTTDDNVKRGMYVGCLLGHLLQKIALTKAAVVLLVSNIKPGTERGVALGAVWELTADVRILLEDESEVEDLCRRKASLMRGGVRQSATFSITNKGLSDD